MLHFLHQIRDLNWEWGAYETGELFLPYPIEITNLWKELAPAISWVMTLSGGLKCVKEDTKVNQCVLSGHSLMFHAICEDLQAGQNEHYDNEHFFLFIVILT